MEGVSGKKQTKVTSVMLSTMNINLKKIKFKSMALLGLNVNYIGQHPSLPQSTSTDAIT